MATRASQRLVLETDRGRQLRQHRQAFLGEPGPFRAALAARFRRPLELAKPGIEDAQAKKSA